jgi:rubrerythrin
MDFLLYFYYAIFAAILITPFLLFHYKFQEEHSPFGKDEEESFHPLMQKKANLLDSLKDLRSDFHSGKITEEEFQTTSIPFLDELDALEEELTVLKKESFVIPLTPIQVLDQWKCANCGSFITVPKAKFCPECGNSRLA